MTAILHRFSAGRPFGPLTGAVCGRWSHPVAWPDGFGRGVYCVIVGLRTQRSWLLRNMGASGFSHMFNTLLPCRIRRTTALSNRCDDIVGSLHRFWLPRSLMTLRGLALMGSPTHNPHSCKGRKD